MSALELLYSGRGIKRERDAKYASAMQQLSHVYPNDDEAQLFYALALLGKSEGVRDVPTYLKAAEIAKSVFAKTPHRPGAAHYWIHGMDDPQHAAGALEAARALSGIAPDAGHAHMCSHIFLPLGMWDDVVRSNLAAAAVVNWHAATAGRPPVACGHYNYWVEYGYLEQGRTREAKNVVAGCRAEAMKPGMAEQARTKVDPDDSSVSSFVEIRARYIVDTGVWERDVTGWTVDMGDALMPKFNAALGTGFAAAIPGNLPAVRESLAALGSLLPKLPAVFDNAGVSPADPARRVPGIQKLHVQALLVSAQGHGDRAIAVMQQAVGMEKDLPFGPPSPEKPSYELLGELLVRQHKARQARSAFENSLKLAPRRTESLLGLARPKAPRGIKRGPRAAIVNFSTYGRAQTRIMRHGKRRRYVSTASHSRK